MTLYDPSGTQCTIEVKMDREEITKQVLPEYNRKAETILRRIREKEETNLDFSEKSDESFYKELREVK